MSKKSEKKHYAIGVDSNQNELAPGIVITSMVKHVNIAVYTAIKDFVDDKFSAEVKHLDLRNGGIDWAFDKYNRSIISQFEIKKINRIRAEIIDGKIKVPDYYETVKKQKQKI
jgi:basic membrane protein A